MYLENSEFFSYDNWVIIKSDNDFNVIFKLEEYSYNKDLEEKNLEEKLKIAVENEDYEKAAILKKSIDKKRNMIK